MIIKNNFSNPTDNINKRLDSESEGIKKAVAKLDERFKNDEIEREKFLLKAQAFAKRHEAIKRLKDKLNK